MKSPSQLPELSFCRLCHLSLDWVAMDFTGGVVPMENWRLRQWNEAFVGTAGILISDQFEMDFTKKLGQNRHLYLPWHTSPPKGPHLRYLQSVWRGSASHTFLEQSTSNPRHFRDFLVSWIPIQKFQSLSTWVGKKENSHRDETRISKKKTKAKCWFGSYL